VAQADDLEKNAARIEQAADHIHKALRLMPNVPGYNDTIRNMDAAINQMRTHAADLITEVDDYRRDSVDMDRGD
jgi:hypothetical protein